MLESVCYITMDNPSNIYRNVNTKCLTQNSKRIGGDGPVFEKSGIVVGINHYENCIYETEIEQLSPNKSYSQCDGPSGIRGFFTYYETSEDVLQSCEDNQAQYPHSQFTPPIAATTTATVIIGISIYYNFYAPYASALHTVTALNTQPAPDAATLEYGLIENTLQIVHLETAIPSTIYNGDEDTFQNAVFAGVVYTIDQ